MDGTITVRRPLSDKADSPLPLRRRSPSPSSALTTKESPLGLETVKVAGGDSVPRSPERADLEEEVAQLKAQNFRTKMEAEEEVAARRAKAHQLLLQQNQGFHATSRQYENEAREVNLTDLSQERARLANEQGVKVKAVERNAENNLTLRSEAISQNVMSHAQQEVELQRLSLHTEARQVLDIERSRTVQLRAEHQRDLILQQETRK